MLTIFNDYIVILTLPIIPLPVRLMDAGRLDPGWAGVCSATVAAGRSLSYNNFSHEHFFHTVPYRHHNPRFPTYSYDVNNVIVRKLLLWGCLRASCIVLFHGRTALITKNWTLHSNSIESLAAVEWCLKSNALGLPEGKLYCFSISMDILTHLTMQSSRRRHLKPWLYHMQCLKFAEISS